MVYSGKKFTALLVTLVGMLITAEPAIAQIEEGSLLPLDAAEEADTVDEVIDTLAADSVSTGLQGQIVAQQGPQKLKIVRREYNYRQQLGLALGMMAFVAVIFTTTQNWNPE